MYVDIHIAPLFCLHIIGLRVRGFDYEDCDCDYNTIDNTLLFGLQYRVIRKKSYEDFDYGN